MDVLAKLEEKISPLELGICMRRSAQMNMGSPALRMHGWIVTSP